MRLRGVVSICGRCQNSTDFGNLILGAAIHSAGWVSQIADASGPIFNALSGDNTSSADNIGVSTGYAFSQGGMYNSVYNRQGFCDSLLSLGDSWLDTVNNNCTTSQPCSASNLNCAPNSTAHWNTFVSNSLGNTGGYASPLAWSIDLGINVGTGILNSINN